MLQLEYKQEQKDFYSACVLCRAYLYNYYYLSIFLWLLLSLLELQTKALKVINITKQINIFELF